ncbi:hypothetical protein EOPP23_09090 [Endozoicomonas sp. OPT23]|uniref:CsgE family curli-type amyloid fiber assembly protein n=1 Tax=Endozoicomonas sp. OPT23 TaxID=2072845 RepID=UPI00129A13A0|nr:CsgE family curli-type amyloid fiber assembly protein [Endozoicomonas sp. OPT23]MRI33137.1 hypothetical protein [Endozoicomonas sp. OPT23]
MRRPGRVILLCFMMSIADISSSKTESSNEITITGILIDQTLTPQGRRFFKSFSTSWRLLEPRDEFNLAIKEYPDPAKSSRIKITWNRKLLFSTLLGPARNQLKQKAEQAANVVNNQLQYIRIIEATQYDPDMDKDEI